MMKAWMVLALAPAVVAPAQEVKDVLIHRAGPMQATQVFTAQTNPVKGAPYMAEAVTETVQRLSDGTRITNSNSTKVYRDSEGRTRTDTTVKALGPWVAEGSGSGKAISSIFDPLTKESLTLHHDTKTATKASLGMAAWTTKGAVGEGITREFRTEIDKQVRVEVDRRVVIERRGDAPVGDVLMPGPAHFVFEGPGAAMAGGALMISDKANVESKSLGKRMIEGVECEGTQRTMTIPEGQIGNDRPIQTVTETWRSPELQVDVLRKHVDPRFGETNYRLVNVVRAEQPRSLFEVPAGYELKEMPAAVNFRMQKLEGKPAQKK
ncbi:MAG TPA: hypothetical protein PLF84_08570 [Bryobacteraceae bacterium]|nr:hypothetical protein [Bryobacterales bacterium]HRJ19084.1 hypothetical protein [Bryobacteraceae bacterium]